MQEENKKVGYAKNVQFGREVFTLSPVAYTTVDFKKLGCDLFHTGSALVESESIKVQMKCFLFIAEFERAAKIRKIAVYHSLLSLPVIKLQRFKEE